MAIVLKNANYLDWRNLHLSKTDLRVSETGNKLLEFDAIVEDGDKIIDLNGKLVTKSFACGHHHAYSALARGMPFPAKAPGDFCEILEYIWWNLDKKLDADMIRASALATALFSAKSGVTFVVDHHSSPFAAKGSLEIMAEAFEQVGVSHLFCIELSDRDGEKALREGFDATETYLQSSSGQGLVGLHASFTVGDDLLNNAVELARKYQSGVHIHSAEDLYDQTYTLDRYKRRVVERLDDAGALDSSKTILAHCLHLDENERKILNKRNCFIAVNTESNLNNRVGSFIADGLSEERIMLGTDGMHSDMIKSAHANYWQSHSLENATPVDIYGRLRNVNKYLSVNGFRGDGDNNLVVFDYDTPTPVTSDNFLGHFFYGMTSAHIDTVISNGKLVVDGKKLVSKSEEDILNFTNEQALRLWKKL